MTITIDTNHLYRGAHSEDSGKGCLLEVTAHLAGEPWSDHPMCVCPVLAAFGRSLNDRIRDDETRTRLLLPFVPRLLNTAGDGHREARWWVAINHVVRVSTPRHLDGAGLTDHAERLRALPVLDAQSDGAWRAAVRDARDAAWDLNGGLGYYAVIRKAVREAVIAKLQEFPAAADADAAAAADVAADAAAAADVAADVAAVVAVDTAADVAAAVDTAADVAADVAAAADVAVAADVAAAAAAAAAAAVAAVADALSPTGRRMYAAVYKEVRTRLDDLWADRREANLADAVELFDRMVALGEESRS